MGQSSENESAQVSIMKKKYGIKVNDAQIRQDICPSAELPISSRPRWKPLCLEDRTSEDKEPEVITFGAAQFSSLRGNIPAPTRIIMYDLTCIAKKRKTPTFLVTIDKYLTYFQNINSQTCDFYSSRLTQSIDNSSNRIIKVEYGLVS
ncbi:hypothetical protein K501DRAFT_272213 [Backusella circina FSU 941]|nr:hypothetical protein K501DRAFT_272213 [Backusella circina FSU 941]